MQERQILDHGFVQPIDYMGNDLDIVQAARVSYGQSNKGVSEDKALLRYLLRHRHTTPFEMCEVKFRCKMPIFVARQWIRHRTANVNEMSMRYTNAPDEFYVPRIENVSLQSTSNKQGRQAEPVSRAVYDEVAALLMESSTVDYARYERIAKELGVARELARTILPVSLYTQWIWKIDLHNLMHFLTLRLDSHAQYEIRVFAQAMADFVAAWVPWAWQAFIDYRMEALTFSRQEATAIGAILNPEICKEMVKLSGLRDREANEFEAKLRKLCPDLDAAAGSA